MPNNLGIAEVLTADLADIAANVNKVGTTADGLAVSPTNPVIRSRALDTATVRVTDHPADVGAETDDPSKMALFVSKSLHNTWVLGGSKLGNAHAVDGLSSGDVVVPA